MRRGALILFLILFAAVPPAWSADATERLLEATRIDDVLRLKLTKEPDKAAVVSYEIDDHRGGILHDQDTFAAEGAVDLSYADFNPLKVFVSSTQATSSDPVQDAINTFASQLAAQTVLVVPKTGGAAGGGGARPECLDPALKIRDRVHDLARSAGLKALKDEKFEGKDAAERKKAAEKKVEADAQARANAVMAEALEICSLRSELASGVGSVEQAVRRIEDAANTPPALADWVADSTGLAGVLRTLDKVEADAKGRVDNRKQALEEREKIQKLLDELIAAFSDVPGQDLALQKAVGGPSELQATGYPAISELGPQLLTQAQTYRERLQAVVEKETALIESLNALQAVLKANAQRRWRDHDSDLVFDTAESNPASITTATVTLRLIHYTFDEKKNTIVSAVDTEAKRSFDVRRGRRLVTEYGVAGVYNDLRYPKYSVRQEADGKKVTRGLDDSNINLAATLNFLCPSCIGHGVYAGFQLGISKAKDYPGLLGGGVLRFGGANRISVASGIMVTWYKDLNKLKVDGPVESEDALKNDLKLRRSPTAWYLAVQYTFP